MAMKPTRKTRKVKEATPVYATAPALTHETYRTTITSKGQIVIPAALRRKFGIKEGTRIQIEMDEQNQRIILTPITREYIHSLRGKYKDLDLLTVLMEDKKREREL